jgi:hypothetical protein
VLIGVLLHLDVALELGMVTHVRRSPMWSAPGKMPLVGRRRISVAPVFPTFARERLGRRLFDAIEAADAAVVTSNGRLAIG